MICSLNPNNTISEMDLLPPELIELIMSKATYYEIELMKMVSMKFNEIAKKLILTLSQIYDFKKSIRCVDYCAINGYMNLMEWTLEQGVKTSISTINNSICSGQLNILRWLKIVQGHDINNIEYLKLASLCGHLNIVKWFREQGLFDAEEIIKCAVQEGNLNILKWIDSIDEQTFLRDQSLCYIASVEGHLLTLQWLIKLQGYVLDDILFGYAVEGGSMDVIKWLKSINCPWTSYTSSTASYAGNHNILQYLITNGCPISEDTFYASIESFKLTTLRILWISGEYEFKKDPSFLDSMCHMASELGNLRALKWIIRKHNNNGLEFWNRAESRDIAIQNGNNHIVEWIDNN